MEYISLELGQHKFIGSLTNTKEIIYRPKQKIQLVLGSNGSGKSSLMRELSPFPANPKDFHKDGYKRITIDHRGHRYVLESVFQPSTKHSFFKDGGENLNQGGTSFAQKELIRREFGITEDLHNLNLGEIRFHAMSPLECRQWFTRMAEADYTYALSVFQKLKDKVRDIQGAIKLNQTRAVQEANKLLTDEALATLKQEIEFFSSTLNNLFAIKPNQVLYESEIERQMSQGEANMKSLAQQVFKLKQQFPNHEQFTGIADIDQAIIKAEAQVNSNQYLANHVATEIEAKQKTLEGLEKANIKSLSEIDEKLIQLNAKIQSLRQSLRTGIELDQPEAALQALAEIQVPISDILYQLKPHDSDYQYREQYRLANERLQALELEKKTLEVKELRLTEQKKSQEHERQAELTECPNCHHQWHRGFNAKEYEAILAALKAVSEAQEANKTLLEAQKVIVQELSDEAECYRQLQHYFNANYTLKPFWQKVIEDKLIITQPTKVGNFMIQFKEDLVYWVQIKSVEEDIKGLIEIKRLSHENSTDHTDALKKSIETLQQQFFNYNTLIRENTATIQRLMGYKTTLQNIQDIEQKLIQLTDEHAKQGDELYLALKKKTLNEAIRLFQMELSQRELRLSKVNIQQGVVDNLRAQLETLEQDLYLTKLLMKELSPTDGLIAKGLMGFIKKYVQQMNQFIEKIWLYPLEIIPFEMKEDEAVDLDYKFKIKVNKTHEVPSLAKGSSAIQEIINLAFKIIAMKYHHLQDMPIILDEFARSFDPAHRASAFSVISNILAYSDFTQLFIISHLEDCYGSLKNADISVLSADNLNLPKDTVYNHCLKMN